jgi:flagellar motor switch protein FliN/FliY
MMEGTAPAFSPQITAYLNTWAEQCAQVLSTIAGSSLKCDISLDRPADCPAAADTDTWLSITLSGALQGSMSLRLNRARAIAMAQGFMGESLDASAELKPEYIEAIEELFRQIAGHVATTVKPVHGEVQLQLQNAAAPSAPAAITAWIHSSSPKFSFVVEIVLSSELVDALTGAKAATAASATAPVGPSVVESPIVAVEATAYAAAASDISAAQNLDLVMNIELGVSLRFGTRQLLLKDILDLTAGSVVELDQHVKDPVDLLLDGRLIARGEVVVIDGNYGLRVTEVARKESVTA